MASSAEHETAQESSGKSKRKRRGGESKRAKYSKPAPALPWMRDATRVDDAGEEAINDVQWLDPSLRESLLRSGIYALFPVQSALWAETAGGRHCTNDICFCAPTGCGKTLAYLLPVLNSLGSRSVTRLRALVVLPTVGLAHQVAGVAQPLCDAVGLSIACSAGTGSSSVSFGTALPHVEQKGAATDSGNELHVDVLVATPGRLVHHLEHQSSFTLEHLRWLVVDEADRLLRQSYQEWLQRVDAASSGASDESLMFSDIGTRTFRNHWSELGLRNPRPRLQKLVLSATLTRDPAKVQKLHLHRPKYMTVQPESESKYTIPPGLKEHRVIVQGEYKPAALLALLRNELFERALIFASSVDTARRLYLMLASLASPPVYVAEYTSRVSQAERIESLDRFKADGGQTNALVASDAAARGMDLQGVDIVISYDVPSFPKTYVHRIGRTARAGRSGRAYTILRPNEARHFKDMVAKAHTHSSESVKPYKLDEQSDLAPLQDECAAALRAAALQAAEEEKEAKSGRVARTLTAAERLAAQQAEAIWSRRLE